MAHTGPLGPYRATNPWAHWRVKAGLTQSQAAKALGLSTYRTVMAVEKGTMRPWPRLVRRMVELYGVPEHRIPA